MKFKYHVRFARGLRVVVICAQPSKKKKKKNGNEKKIQNQKEEKLLKLTKWHDHAQSVFDFL